MTRLLVSAMPLWCRYGSCCAGIPWVKTLEKIRPAVPKPRRGRSDKDGSIVEKHRPLQY
ncbi:MAG: hypothetical protein JXB29_03055 [Sedimentisphaerales bacterium]|nr:hypothetical protein [Sedimentisphaerales bacterium]